MESLYKNRDGLNKKSKIFDFSNYKKLYVIVIFIFIILIIILLILFNNKFVPALKMVSGTEYISGENGQVIVRLENENGNAIEDANCFLTILYPDKTYFLIDIPMKETTILGNYYHSFITPSKEGIYEEYISCELNKGDSMYNLQISNSFHVSSGLNLIVEMSKKQEIQYKELIKKIDSLDSNFSSQINDLNSKVYNLQTTMDYNVLTDINSLAYDISIINNNLESSVNNMENNLNQIMQDNFEELYNKFRDSYNVMSEIFISD
jgi:hypothetical protein